MRNTRSHDRSPRGAPELIDLADATRSAIWLGCRMRLCLTRCARRPCRITDRVGSIAAGQDADLIAVAGDPLTDIAAVRNVIAIFRRGVRVANI